MATSYRLTVQRGPNVGKIYELVKDVATLGRDMSNDIVINDSESSRHHARLTKQGVTYVIEDLGSTNGTFVNSARLSSPRPLSPGDVVGLGETISLTFEVITTPPTGATMIGGSIDATVVATDKDFMPMGTPAPIPEPEPATASMPEPSFDMPPASEPEPAYSSSPSSYSSSSYSSPSSSSSYSSSSSPSSDAFSAPPASTGGTGGGSNRNLIIGIVVGVLVLCCCCFTLLGAYYAYASGMFG
jgi:predicted component of type VI protein secretion system